MAVAVATQKALSGEALKRWTRRPRMQENSPGLRTCTGRATAVCDGVAACSHSDGSEDDDVAMDRGADGARVDIGGSVASPGNVQAVVMETTLQLRQDGRARHGKTRALATPSCWS